jgi:hypothetical protein
MDDANPQGAPLLPGASPIRHAWRPGVFIAALTAPLLAAFLGAVFVFALAVMLGADPAYGWADITGALPGVLIFSLISLIFAVPITWLTAGPLMAAGWYLAHRRGWRGPGAMALVMACTGLIYGAGFFGLIWGKDFMLLAGAAGGFLAGLPTGALISVIAYRKSGD